MAKIYTQEVYKKAIALLALLTCAVTAEAYVIECEQDTTLSCKVTYNKRQSAKIEASSSAKFELQQQDEPSLAYCEAWNAFIKHGLVIEATLLADTNKLNIRMMRETLGGRVSDQHALTITLKPGQEASASLTLNNDNVEGVFAAEITCKSE